jgi:hypothetical protein
LVTRVPALVEAGGVAPWARRIITPENPGLDGFDQLSVTLDEVTFDALRFVTRPSGET